MTAGDLGVDISSSATVIKSFSEPPKKEAGKIFKGEDVAVMVDKVVTALRDEAKVL